MFRFAKKLLQPMFDNPILREKTTDFVKMVGGEMYNVVGGYNIPNIAGVAVYVGVLNVLGTMKRLGDDFWVLWDMYEENPDIVIRKRTNVSPFKEVSLLPKPKEGEKPAVVLGRLSDIEWTVADIYGEEVDEEGDPILPESVHKSILKKPREEGEDGPSGAVGGSKRVRWNIKPGHPRDQQPPFQRP